MINPLTIFSRHIEIKSPPRTYLFFCSLLSFALCCPAELIPLDLVLLLAAKTLPVFESYASIVGVSKSSWVAM